MSVVFTRGGAVIELQNPAVQNTLGVEKLGAGNRSAGGTRYWYPKGITLYTLQLHWPEMRDSEKRDLLDFFDTAAEGPRYDFTYRDHRGYVWTAYFQDERLDFSEVADQERSAGTFISGGVTYPTTDRYKGIWEVEVLLEVEEIVTTTPE